jgi:hypothetical protein
MYCGIRWQILCIRKQQTNGKILPASSTIESKLTIFSKPSLYVNLKFPKKLPPPQTNITLSQVPIIGYMEQTCGTVLVDAFKLLIDFKPKFPAMNSKNSVLLYLSIYLKGRINNSLKSHPKFSSQSKHKVAFLEGQV